MWLQARLAPLAEAAAGAGLLTLAFLLTRPLAIFVTRPLAILAQPDLEEHQQQRPSQPERDQHEREQLADQAVDHDGAYHAGEHERAG
jgi:hypothetical protein